MIKKLIWVLINIILFATDIVVNGICFHWLMINLINLELIYLSPFILCVFCSEIGLHSIIIFFNSINWWFLIFWRCLIYYILFRYKKYIYVNLCFPLTFSIILIYNLFEKLKFKVSFNLSLKFYCQIYNFFYYLSLTLNEL